MPPAAWKWFTSAQPVRIDAREQRHEIGKLRNVLPGKHDARGAGHRDEVHRVVRRAAGRMQADDAVDDRPFVDHLAGGREFVAERGDRKRPLRRFPGQRVAKRRAGIDEGSAWQVEAHDLHQHLVGIGGAVEGTGTRAVIGLGLGLQELVAADLAFGEELPNLGLLIVRQARGHRSGGDEDRGQMAEGERGDQRVRARSCRRRRDRRPRRTCCATGRCRPPWR